MIKCKICNNTCDDSDYFCKHCGAQLVSDDNIDEAILNLEKKYFLTRRRRRSIRFAIIVVIVFMIIGAVLFGISAKMYHDIRHGNSSLNSTVMSQAAGVLFYKTHISNNSRYINYNKNLTISAATELTGPEIIALAEENDYQWQADFYGWLRPNDYAAMVNIKPGTYELDSTELSSFRSVGSLCYMMGVLNVTQCSNLKEAFYSIANLEIIDFEYINDQVVSVVKNNQGSVYFVYGFNKEDEGNKMNVFEIYSELSIENGFLNEYAERDLGKTMNEVWSGITKRDLNL